VCGPLEVERYLSRFSGPLLDRIDIHIEVPPVPYRELSARAYHCVLKIARTIADLAAVHRSKRHT